MTLNILNKDALKIIIKGIGLRGRLPETEFQPPYCCLMLLVESLTLFVVHFPHSTFHKNGNNNSSRNTNQ